MSRHPARRRLANTRGRRVALTMTGLVVLLLALSTGVAAAVAPASAPTNLKATSGVAIGLAWTAPPDAPVDHYVIQRGSTAADMAPIATVQETSYVDREVTAGTTYVYEVRGADELGTEGPPSDPAQATAQYLTALTVTASSGSVVAGSAATLTAMLALSPSTPLPDQAIEVFAWPVTTRQYWVRLGMASAGPTPGSYVFVVRPTAQTFYRFAFSGSGLNAASDGSVAVLARLQLLGAPVSPSQVRAGKAFAVSGHVKPHLANGKKMIRVAGYQRSHGRWLLKRTWMAVNRAYKGYTKYRVSLKLPTRGAWRLQAQYLSKGTLAPFLAASSGYRSVRATR